MKYLLLIALLVSTAQAEVKKGEHFVELDATTSNGKHFRLKDMAGKWVLFTFGASWCEPCHKELPAWDKIAPQLGGKVLFVAVNIDNDQAAGEKFIKSLALKHTFPVYLPDENSPGLKAYDPDKMPSTFVIDPQGVVRTVHYGYKKGDEDQLVSELAALIKQRLTLQASR